MKKNKGLLSYLFILIVLAAGAFVICIAIMCLSPGTAIAGFAFQRIKTDEIHYCKVFEGEMHSTGYYANQATGDAGASYLNTSNVSAVVVNAGGHDVEVRQLSGTDEYNIRVSTVYSGIYSVKKYPTAFDFYISHDDTKKLLTINFVTPNGLNFTSKGKILIDLPEGLAVSPAEIISNNASLELAEAFGLAKASLEINTNTGNVYLGGVAPTGETINTCGMSQVSVTTTKGSIDINENFFPVGNKLSLTTQKGKVSLNHSIQAQAMEVSLNAQKGQFNLAGQDNTFKVKNINITNKKADIILGKVQSNVSYNGENGRLIAKEITGNVTCSDETYRANFNIDKVGGQFLLPKGSYSDVTIGEIAGKAEINAKNSVINISNASADIFITTTKGRVNLNKCSKLLNISAGKASVNLTNCSGSYNITASKGNISGSITGIVGASNTIKTERGEINLQIAQTLAFNLTAYSTNKSVNINFASINQSADKFDNLEVNGGDELNVLTLGSRNNTNIVNYVESEVA